MQKNLLGNIIRLFFKKNVEDDEVENNLEIKKIVSFIVVFASTILTLMNLYNHYYLMALSTSLLTISFLLCVFLCIDKSNIKIINGIMSISLIIVFSYYAISGQNNGFAILWVLLVPIVSIIVIGIRNGMLLSLYFQILLIVMFYTPVRNIVSLNYNETFKNRFPLLFLVNFSLSIYVTLRNEKNKSVIKKALNYDSITGLPNRDLYDGYIEKLDTNSINLFLIKIKGLEYVNAEYFHDAGNKLIKYASDHVRTVFKDKYLIYKISDTIFAVITKEDVNDLSNFKKQICSFSFRYKNIQVKDAYLLAAYSSISETKNNTYMELEKITFDKLNDLIGKKN